MKMKTGSKASGDPQSEASENWLCKRCDAVLMRMPRKRIAHFSGKAGARFTVLFLSMQTVCPNCNSQESFAPAPAVELPAVNETEVGGHEWRCRSCGFRLLGLLDNDTAVFYVGKAKIIVHFLRIATICPQEKCGLAQYVDSPALESIIEFAIKREAPDNDDKKSLIIARTMFKLCGGRFQWPWNGIGFGPVWTNRLRILFTGQEYQTYLILARCKDENVLADGNEVASRLIMKELGVNKKEAARLRKKVKVTIETLRGEYSEEKLAKYKITGVWKDDDD